jgi:hypothetical protein
VPDLPEPADRITFIVDHEAQPGNVVVPLANLLFSLADARPQDPAEPPSEPDVIIDTTQQPQPGPSD